MIPYYMSYEACNGHMKMLFIPEQKVSNNLKILSNYGEFKQWKTIKPLKILGYQILYQNRSINMLKF